MTSPVPVIDLAAATDPPRDLLDEVKTATETVGVVQVLNHGVPDGLVGEFDQRIRRRLSLAGDGEASRSRSQEYLTHHSHRSDEHAELRDLAFRYSAAAQSVVHRVLALYARAQRLPEQAFPVGPLPYLGFTENSYPTWTYPDTGNDEDKLLLLEGADAAAVTLLAQAGDGHGIQVQLPDKRWQPVPAVPGALHVLTGTWLTRWTNGLLPPARHRICTQDAARRSVAIFYYLGFA